MVGRDRFRGAEILVLFQGYRQLFGGRDVVPFLLQFRRCAEKRERDLSPAARPTGSRLDYGHKKNLRSTQVHD